MLDRRGRGFRMNTHVVMVRATDPYGDPNIGPLLMTRAAPRSQAVTITVDNVNEAPMDHW